jgi:hypothetical protein
MAAITAARRAIAEMAAYIERESKSRAIVDDFIDEPPDGNGAPLLLGLSGAIWVGHWVETSM